MCVTDSLTELAEQAKVLLGKLGYELIQQEGK